MHSANPLCDLSKTDLIESLLEVVPEKRDEEWLDSFYSHVAKAAFQIESQVVISDEEDLPYVMLATPSRDKQATNHSILTLKKFLTNNGYGVAISITTNEVNFWLTYGDIIWLSDIRKESMLRNRPIEVNVENSFSFFVGHPAEEFMSVQTRKLLREHLQKNGIESPKVLLVGNEIENEFLFGLVFNFFAEDFKTEQEYQKLLALVKWFLPKHYQVVSISKGHWSQREFEDL